VSLLEGWLEAMGFSDRNGIKPKYPPRSTYEEAPERLRSLLYELMDDAGAVAAYHRLCGATGKVPDPQVWGESYARQLVQSMVMDLEWWEVFDQFEAIAEGRSRFDERVNDMFARCGLAYEMLDGQIWLFDEEGEALGVSGVEHEAVVFLKGKYAPVRKQYEKALEALNGRPADLEKAVSESFGALEAVAQIQTGNRDFGKAVDLAFSKRDGMGAMAASLKAMYGYASQLPGARHGRHKEPDLTFEDAKFVVRTTGISMAYLISTDD